MDHSMDKLREFFCCWGKAPSKGCLRVKVFMEKCLECRLIQVNLDLLISGFFTLDDTDFGLRNSQNGSGYETPKVCVGFAVRSLCLDSGQYLPIRSSE
jgi:hypothetical protein